MFFMRKIRKSLKRIGALVAAIAIALFVGTGDSEKEPVKETEGLILSTVENEDTERNIFEETDDTNEKKDYTYIILANEMTTINGKGAAFSNGRVTISEGGTYLFKGGLSDGSICVDLKGESEKVVLKLCGVGINSTKSAALSIKNSTEKTVVEVVEGTVNTLSDTADREETFKKSYEDSAVIFSKDKLLICGEGTLNVSASFNKGIFSKNNISVNEAVLNINSADDGIRSKDNVYLKNAKLKITCGGDGIRTRNDNNKDREIVVTDSEILINTERDGIHSEGRLTIDESKVDIISSGGSTGNHTEKDAPTIFEEPKAHSEDKKLSSALKRATPESSALEEILVGSSTCYGLRSKSEGVITDSDIKISSVDDAVYGQALTIENSDLVLYSDDDGLHGEEKICAVDSKINVAEAFEGFESKEIEISGGRVNIKAFNNGFDITDDSDKGVNISHSYVHLNSAGKNDKSVANICLSEGMLVVVGSERNDIHSDTYTVNSGTLLVLGEESAARNIKSEGIPVIAFTQSRSKNAFTVIADSKGEGVIGFSSPRKYKSVLLVSDKLKEDEYYELYDGGRFTGEAVGGVYTEGEYSGGTLIRKLSKPLINLDKTG